MNKQLVALICAGALFGTSGCMQWTLELESGAVSAGYADVRIPGDFGTDVSLTDDLSAEAAPYFRGRIGVRFNEKNRLELELAPVTLKAQGSVASDVNFAGATFLALDPLSASYRFDTYRIIYRRQLRSDERLRTAIGGSLLVRDAAITLSNSTLSAEDTDLGLVPLFGFEAEWLGSGQWSFVIDGNALVGTQGRAEDIFIGARYSPNDAVDFEMGYRIVEGGADVESVYTFAALNYAAFVAAFHF